MSTHKILAAVAFASTLLLNQTIQVGACRCASRELCDYVEDADVVVRATAVYRSDDLDVFDDVTYIIDSLTFYKEEDDETYGHEISFSTAGNTAACGVVMEIGEEYLLGLSRVTADSFSTESEPQFTVNSCGLARVWDSVSIEDQNTLAENGCNDDPCDGSCGDFQECLLNDDGLIEDEYFCADVCDPSPCSEDEVCSLVQLVQCFRAPCPPNAGRRLAGRAGLAQEIRLDTRKKVPPVERERRSPEADGVNVPSI